MSLTWLLDDETSEAIVRCDAVDPGLEHLAVFAKQVRGLGDGPAPPVSQELQALITSGGGQGHGAVERNPMFADQTVTATSRAASLGLAAKLGLGAAAATLGMAGAAAAGVLPDQANDALRHAVEAVTPVEFTEPSDEHPTNFGDRVSTDATGAGDGQPGVDGDTISDEAPGAAHRPADPGTPASTGLDRAAQTPAAPQLPADVPATQDDETNGPPEGAPADPPASPNGGASGDHTPPSTPAPSNMQG